MREQPQARLNPVVDPSTESLTRCGSRKEATALRKANENDGASASGDKVVRIYPGLALNWSATYSTAPARLVDEICRNQPCFEASRVNRRDAPQSSGLTARLRYRDLELQPCPRLRKLVVMGRESLLRFAPRLAVRVTLFCIVPRICQMNR